MKTLIRKFLQLAAGALFLSVTVLGQFVSEGPLPTARAAACDTVCQLNQTLQAAKADQQKKLQQAQQNQQLATAAQQKIQDLANQISVVQNAASQTQQDAADTQTAIAQTNQQVAELESALRTIKDQQNELVRQLYIMRVSTPDELSYFSNESLSERERKQQQYSALTAAVEASFEKTTSSEMAVKQTQQQLTDQATRLAQLHQQQVDQQQSLASYQNTQQKLKTNAIQTMQQLQTQAQLDAQQEGKIEQQISAEVAKLAAAGNLGQGGCVVRGQVVGGEGSTGNSTGPHVHFETRIGSTAVDPTGYINSGLISYPLKSFVITQGYGWTAYAKQGAYNGQPHTGLDVSATTGQGTPVLAPADSCIIHHFYDPGGYGNYFVEQLSDGLIVLLGHLLHF